MQHQMIDSKRLEAGYTVLYFTVFMWSQSRARTRPSLGPANLRYKPPAFGSSAVL